MSVHSIRSQSKTALRACLASHWSRPNIITDMASIGDKKCSPDDKDDSSLKIQDSYVSSRRKLIPPPLNLNVDLTRELTDRLTEFAVIATSPRSPLMQKNLPIRKRAYSYPSMESLHSDTSQTSVFNSVEELCHELSPDDDDFVFGSDLTPEDTNAIFVLSNMAKNKYDMMSPPVSPNKRCLDSQRVKRPMNGFMLFAKKFRVEYTQQHPGKDNRAISVLLGETWKKMKLEERHAYAEEAKKLAEEHKKLHPDCWKRKRSLSSS